MLTKTDILDAINTKLVAQWPERTVYVDVCPVDFERPSFWLYVQEDKTTDASRACLRREMSVVLVLYDELDEDYTASWARLNRDADAAARLLLPPLAVQGRMLTAAMRTRPREADKTAIELKYIWLDDRGDAAGQETPAAQDYSLRVECK